MRRAIFLVACVFLALIGALPLSADDKVVLTFAHWGSPLEKEAMAQLCKGFEQAHPNVIVNVLYTPANYDERLSAMVAGGIAPDVAYCHEGPAFKWAEDGVIMDLKPFIDKDPEVSYASRIPASWYKFDKGKKILGAAIAGEIMLLYYNKDIFDEFGVPYPPSDPDKAWTWDQFVDAAKKLTRVTNGQKTFGVSIGTWPGPILPLLRSNGGDYVNDSVTAPLINSPASVEVLQKLADLMNVYHVAPTPTDLESSRALNISMQSKQVAMAIDGQWMLLDLAKAGFRVGIAPLPVFKKPVSLFVGAPLVLFSSTKHPKEAWELSKWIQNIQNSLPNYRSGLWMPIQLNWYKDPSLVAKWVDNDAHPPEYRQAAIDYLLKYGSQLTSFYVSDWDEIQRVIIQDSSDLWLGKEDAKTAADKMAADLQPLLKGRTDK
jgi:multiple sugar transport system substrate-binding protein